MHMTEAGIALIKEFEGFRSEAYVCQGGKWTIGYGHTAAAGEPSPKAGMKITEEAAEKILRLDLATFEAAVRKALKRPATPEQFSAMVSLAFNIGGGAFGKSTMVRRFNAGDIDGAAEALTWWNKAGGKTLRGLVRRREAERQLFLSGRNRAAEEAPAGPITGGEQKPLAKSKTVGGAGLGVVAATGLGLWQQFQDAGVPEMLGTAAPWVLVAIFGFLLVNRWLEARRGEH